MKTSSVFAALAAGAMLPLAASAAWDNTAIFTNTVNGITWRYIVDDDAKAISLYSINSTDTGAMIDQATAGQLYVPTRMTHTNGVVYNVTRLNHNGFINCKSLTGIVFPETTFAQTTGGYGYNSAYNGKELFKYASGIVAIWWRGPSTVASGTQPVSKTGRTTYTFNDCKALKAVVLGPNVTYTSDGGASYPLFLGCTDVKAFFPKARWKNLQSGSYSNNTTQCKGILYGPGEDIDVSIDGKFTVATAERLDDVLSVANYLHTYCDMNPKISVTNAIEFTEGLITADRMRFATFNSLMFKVNTQAQLKRILDAVPASIPLAIDPSGITEDLTVPAARKIFVQLSETDAVRLKVKGLKIIVQ